MEFIINYFAFILTVTMMTIIPGPDTILVLTKTVTNGRKDALICVGGIFLGLSIHSALSILGLSLIIINSASLFMAIKVAGALYLCYLGIVSFKNSKKSFIKEANEGTSSISLKRSFLQGLFTNLLNPKVILIFLALFPQFIDKNANSATPFLILCGTFFAIGFSWHMLVILLSSKLKEKLHSPKYSAILNIICGIIFILLAINCLCNI